MKIKRAYPTIKEREHRLSKGLIMALDLSPLIAFVVDENNHILYYNNKFKEYFTIEDRYPAKEVRIFQQSSFEDKIFDMLYKKGAVLGEKLLFLNKEEQPFWGALHASALDDQHHVFYIKDIHQEVLLKLKYSQSFQQSPFAIMQLGPGGEIIEINAASEFIFQSYKEEIVGRNFLEWVASEDKEKVKVALLCNGIPGELKEFPCIKLLRNKEKNFTAQVHLAQGVSEPIRQTIFIINTEFSEQQKEVLAQKNRELTKINRQLDAFLYSVYHDLRSPLSSIEGLVSLMKLPSEEGNVLEYTGMMEQSIQKLYQVLENMTMISQNSRTRLDISEIQLEELILEILTPFKKVMDSKGIHFQYDATLEECFYSDKNRIYNILTHLLKNAVDFYDKGKLYPKIQLKIQVDKKCMKIQMKDNGIGIRQDQLDQIFELFYRGSEVSKGSGLGLYIVQETLNRLNGDVEVSSEPGSGTQFTIEIPNDIKGRLVAQKRKLQDIH